MMPNKYQDVFDALEKNHFGVKKEKYLENLDNAEERKTYGDDNVKKEFYIPIKATSTKTIYANAVVEACNFADAMRIFRNTPEYLLDIHEDYWNESDEWLEPYEYDEEAEHFYDLEGRGIKFDPEEEMNKITGMEEIDFKHVEGQNLIWRDEE